jgi:hypothetical protein
MANQFEKGRAFSPGDTVEAADLNNLVDLATGISGLIAEQSTAAPDQPTLDTVLFWDSSAAPPNRLRKCTVSAIAAGTVTSVGLTVAPTSIFNLGGTASPITTFGTFAFSLKVQNRNLFLAGSPTTNATVPTFRAIVPADIFTDVPIAAHAIDLTLGNLFTKTLANGDQGFTFTDGTGTPGQVFKVRLQRAASGGTGVITWSALGAGGDIKWPGGTVPVMTVGANKVDIFEFVCTANNKYAGIRWGADMS